MFLGVIINEALSWNSHITNVAGKIAKSVGIIYRASFCLPISSLCTLNYSLVHPYLAYCISVWGSTYASNLNRILLLQTKVIRMISKSAFDAHTDPLFVQVEILKFYVNCIYKFQTLKFMFHSKTTFPLIFSMKCFP